MKTLRLFPMETFLDNLPDVSHRQKARTEFLARQAGKRLPGRPRIFERRLIPRNVLLTQEMLDHATILGGDNINKGVRAALSKSIEQHKEDNDR